MDDARWQKIQGLFARAAELEGADERARLLDRECADDADLRAEVESLLAVDSGSSSRIERPIGEAARASLGDGAALAAGERVGPYRIVRELGRGGMGTVYHAQQKEPVARDVALKLINPGMDSREVVRRFDAERRALARMDHPNVAKVYDAGATATGAPYFAMELVDGAPLTAFADARCLEVGKRVRLFIRVCEAVQHAHQKGILHRDLKAGNVLVAEVDGRAQPKVIDFGIAMALDEGEADATRHTRLGQLLGTPATMSPEQAAGLGDVDTRSDLYSLGVLLYELLSGFQPFAAESFRGLGITGVQQILRDVVPRRPSARVREAPEGEARTIAGARASDPATLARRLAGDLDWIVMRCLEKEPARRYASVGELARDLERHLADEPVAAGPPGAGYRIRKFARRHRGPLIAASLVAIALVAGIVGTSVGLVKSAAAESRAQTEADIARAVNQFLNQDLLAAVDPANQGIDVTMREVLDTAAERIEGRFSDQPEVEAAIRLTLGSTLFNLGQLDRAEPHYERAFELRSSHLGDAHAETLAAENELVNLRLAQGRYEEVAGSAAALARRAASTLGAGHPVTLRAHHQLAKLHVYSGRYADAIPLLRTVLEGQRRTHGEAHRRTLDTLNDLALTLDYAGRIEEAERLYRQAIDLQKQHLGPEHPDTLTTLGSLAGMLSANGRDDEARPIREALVATKRRLLGPEHPGTALALKDLAISRSASGDPEGALALLNEAYAIHREAYGETHPETLATRAEIGFELGELGRHREAEATYREVYQAARQALGPDQRDTLFYATRLANRIVEAGRLDEAEALLRDTLERQRRTLGDEQRDTLSTFHVLGALLLRAGRPDDADGFLTAALEGRAEVFGAADSATLKSARKLEEALRASGRDDRAAELRSRYPAVDAE